MFEKRFAQKIPRDERRLDADLSSVGVAYRRLIEPGLQLREAPGKFSLAAAIKLRARQVRRPAMKIMKEGPRNRRKYRAPAQQSEQRVDEPIFDVMHRRAVRHLSRQVISRLVFNRASAARLVEHEFEAG